MINIYIDADACAVKSEVYKVAARYKLVAYVVANQYLNLPMDINIRMEVVSGGFDAADDWIVEHIQKDDILITSDILLADRVIKLGARVVGQKGRELNSENIGEALASRELASHLRDLGERGTGPSAMSKVDRSHFLSALDRIIQSIKNSR